MAKITDMNQHVTNTIIEKLESGTIPWNNGCDLMNQHNFTSDHVYTGINPLILSCTDFLDSRWAGFAQIKKLGGTVLKGSKGTPIVYVSQKVYPTGKKNSNGEDETKSFMRVGYKTIFNITQTTLLDDERFIIPDTQPKENQNIKACEDIIRKYINPPTIQHDNTCGGVYKPHSDVISLPEISRYHIPERYYKTLFHEYLHSTGHLNRLDRLDNATFGSHAYSKEEMTAELGAAFLMSRAGYGKTTIDNSAAYIESWLKVLRGDKKFIMSSASKAQAGVNHILNV